MLREGFHDPCYKFYKQSFVLFVRNHQFHIGIWSDKGETNLGWRIQNVKTNSASFVDIRMPYFSFE